MARIIEVSLRPGTLRVTGGGDGTESESQSSTFRNEPEMSRRPAARYLRVGSNERITLAQVFSDYLPARKALNPKARYEYELLSSRKRYAIVAFTTSTPRRR
jgi:hypothetical protein